MSGYADVEWIIDDGYSAKDVDRPGLQDALSALGAGQADILIASRLDRIARNTFDFLGLVAKAHAEGWRIRVLDGDIDMSTPEGELQITMLAAFAAFERRRIGQRQKVSVQVKKANGTYKGLARSAPHVRDRILQMRSDGLSNNRIAQVLNGEGIKSPGGSTWTRKTIWGLANDGYRREDDTPQYETLGVR
jgi:DNA invertase Pin-like site-specific DNA recombinase